MDADIKNYTVIIFPQKYVDFISSIDFILTDHLLLPVRRERTLQEMTGDSWTKTTISIISNHSFHRHSCCRCHWRDLPLTDYFSGLVYGVFTYMLDRNEFRWTELRTVPNFHAVQFCKY